jgi:hypothetical protein
MGSAAYRTYSRLLGGFTLARVDAREAAGMSFAARRMADATMGKLQRQGDMVCG